MLYETFWWQLYVKNFTYYFTKIHAFLEKYLFNHIIFNLEGKRVLFHYTGSGDKVANNDTYSHSNLSLPQWISYNDNCNKLLWNIAINVAYMLRYYMFLQYYILWAYPSYGPSITVCCRQNVCLARFAPV